MKQTIQLIKYFSRRPTISLFLLAFIIRLAYFLLIAPWQPQVVQDVIIKKDAVGYQQLALNLKENAVFSTSKSSPYKPNLLRTPLYPALLAGIYGIFGENIWVVLYIQIFLGICTVLLAYAIGIQYFNHKTAFLSALLFSFDYTTVFYTLNLLTETLFTFLFMLTIYFLTRYFNHQPLAIYDPRSSNSGQFDPGLNSRMNALFSGLHFPLLLSGFFLALATLTRPVSVYFFLFLLPVFFMKFKKQRLKAALTFSLFTLTFLLALSPWLIRNYRVSGKITVSSQQEKALNWAFPRLHRSFQHPLRKGSWKFEDITHDLEHLGVGVVQLFTTIGSSGVPRMLGLTYRHTEYSDQQQGLIHPFC